MLALLTLVLTFHVDDPKPVEIDYEKTINDYRSEGVTAKTNANMLLWQALGPMSKDQALPDAYFKTLGIKRPPMQGNYFLPAEAYSAKVLNRDAKSTMIFMYMVRTATKQPWSGEYFEDVEGWLAANAEPMKQVTVACERPRYFSPLIAPRTPQRDAILLESSLANVQRYRDVGTAFLARAMRSIAQNKPAQAWADLLTVQRLARHVATRGTLIELLVGTSLQLKAVEASLLYLTISQPDAKLLRSHLEDLSKLPESANLVEIMDHVERFTFTSVVSIVKNGGPSALSDPHGKPKAGELIMMGFIDWSIVQSILDAWFDRAITTLKQPTYPEQLAAAEDYIEELRAIELKLPKNVPATQRKAISEQMGRILVRTLMPAFQKVAEAQIRGEQWHDILRLALMLKLYYAENERYPTKLSELVPKYMTEVPIDHFTGKPLTYRSAKVGYIAYSVGPNLKDDDGRGSEGTNPSDDISIQMLPPSESGDTSPGGPPPGLGGPGGIDPNSNPKK